MLILERLLQILLFLCSDFVISYHPNQENGRLENYICVPAFRHSSVPIDHALSVAALAVSSGSFARANHTKSAKHVVNYLSHAFVPTCTYLH